MKPSLSVIIPIYNKIEYLSECIDSVLNQSKKDIEVILVDDGSTDGCNGICDEYKKKDKRIKVIHQTNKGPTRARIKGISISDGEYITFVDADDFIAERSYVYAEDAMSRRADLIMFGISRYHSDNYIREQGTKYSEGIYYKEWIESHILSKLLWDEEDGGMSIDPSLCNKIIKKDIFNGIDNMIGNLDIKYGEDIAVIVPLLMKISSIAVINKSYYFHRQRESGAVPEYILNDDYFDKLYDLYLYIKGLISQKSSLFPQLERFYCYAVNQKASMLGMYRDEYLFPFDRVEKGKRIILYGAGKIGKKYYDQIKKISYCAIVKWVDTNYESFSKHEKEIYSPEAIFNESFDHIVIAIKNTGVKDKIIEWLVGNGVPAEKIV